MTLPDGFDTWADTYFGGVSRQEDVLREQMSMALDRMQSRMPEQTSTTEDSESSWDEEDSELTGQEERLRSQMGDVLDRMQATMPPAPEEEESEAWKEEERLEDPLEAALEKLKKERPPVTKEEFDAVYTRLKRRIQEVIQFDEARLPGPLQTLRTAVVDANKVVEDFTKENPPKYNDAMRELTSVLKSAVNAAAKKLRPHEKHMRQYYRDLKSLKDRIEYADDIAPAAAGTAWAVEAGVYTTKKAELINSQNDREYKDACTKLEELNGTITTLINKRISELNAAKTTATGPTATGTNVKTFVDQLKDVEVSALSSEDQVSMLKALRTNRGAMTDPDELSTRCKLLRNMKMNEEFERKDRKNRGKVVASIMDNPKFEEARDNWAEWSKTDEGVIKQQMFLVLAAKLQCEVLGHPEPNIKFDRQRQCDTCDDDHGQPSDGCVGANKCNGVLPGSTTFRKGSAVVPPCNHCGENDYAEFSADEGSCGTPEETDGRKTGPSPININTVPETSFGDFQEVLDSLMHENAHAYQMHVVYDRIGVAPFTDPGPAPDPDTPEHKKSRDQWNNRLKPQDDPDLYKQAMMFYENELAYVGPQESENEDNGKTYMKEPLEDHAWSFGPAVARESLIRRMRDTDPEQNMQETLHIKAFTEDQNKIVVEFKEFHGLEKGDRITFSGVADITANPDMLNGKTLEVTYVDSSKQVSVDVPWAGYEAASGGRCHVRLNEASDLT